jgi:methionine-rich copper-binding protein CopC
MAAPTHRLRRSRPLAAAALAAALATAPPALAHSDVVATSPRDGAVLAQPPQRVVVTYGDVLGAATSARVVAGGRDIAGTPRLDPRDARRLVVPLGAAASGAHRVEWEVVGADGHTLTGAIAFRVRGADGAQALTRVGARLIAASEAVMGALPAA